MLPAAGSFLTESADGKSCVLEIREVLSTEEVKRICNRLSEFNTSLHIIMENMRGQLRRPDEQIVSLLRANQTLSAVAALLEERPEAGEEWKIDPADEVQP